MQSSSFKIIYLRGLANISDINTIVFKVSAKAEKHIRQGHPWVFESSIRAQKTEGSAGDIAVIFDQRKNQFLAMGLYDPDSPIRIKVLSTMNGERWNEPFLEEKILNAIKLRKPLHKHTDGYRVLFGENDGLGGLICDKYADVLVIKLYSAVWIPYLDWIVDILSSTIKSEAIVLRLSRLLSKNKSIELKEGQILHGTLKEEEVIITEYGVRFKINVLKGHKTGFFLDHRNNRYRIQQASKSKNVLDVFAYAGGFSIHALAGGAASATSVDISQQALQLATQNASMNKHKGIHKTICGDAFTILSDLITQKKKYEIVIIDPPAFAKSSKEITLALSQYKRLARLGAELVNKNGLLLLASCSSRITSDMFYTTMEAELSTTKRQFTRELKTAHDIDHPIGFTEGAYLKSGYYRMS